MDNGVGHASPVFVWLLVLSLAFLTLIYVIPDFLAIFAHRQKWLLRLESSVNAGPDADSP